MIKYVQWIIAGLLFVPFLSGVVYGVTKAARYGWLRAEQLFFKNDSTNKGER